MDGVTRTYLAATKLVKRNNCDLAVRVRRSVAGYYEAQVLPLAQPRKGYGAAAPFFGSGLVVRFRFIQNR